jgi:hypothetical protein
LTFRDLAAYRGTIAENRDLRALRARSHDDDDEGLV